MTHGSVSLGCPRDKWHRVLRGVLAASVGAAGIVTARIGSSGQGCRMPAWMV